MIKKKTYALLGKMFKVYPQCIADFMNILAKKLLMEKNTGLLSILVSVILIGIQEQP